MVPLGLDASIRQRLKMATPNTMTQSRAVEEAEKGARLASMAAAEEEDSVR